MRKSYVVCAGLMAGAATLLAGPPPPVPVFQGTTLYASARPPVQTPAYVYQQRPLAAPPALITPEQGQAIIDHFKAAYAKPGGPRFLIYQLGDDQAALKLSGTNVVSQTVARPVLTLADKQTVRDVERLFGRPLRLAGVSVVDQEVARKLIGDRPLEQFIGLPDNPQARTNRAALSEVADVVVEVLMSARNLTIPSFTGDLVIAVPDIQATAIRLADSQILGQAASADVITRVPPAALRSFGVNDITEATALTLLDDMTPETK